MNNGPTYDAKDDGTWPERNQSSRHFGYDGRDIGRGFVRHPRHDFSDAIERISTEGLEGVIAFGN